MNFSVRRRLIASISIACLCVTPLWAQSDDSEIEPTLPDDWVSQMSWRSIGPANMSGRITAIAVDENDSNTYWLASASGGLLKTTNNGVTFEHQFDSEATVSIGDVQVARSDSNIVWVGTGEHNPRNSVSWGNGVYKSVDGGATWKHMGLDKIFQTGKIAIHPNDPDIVYVGAMGRLWGPNEDRGLYKTTDGGETWEKILYVDDKTGVIDLKMHPTDPYTLIAATYERSRDGFDGNDPATKNGPGSGLYKTTDGGENWTKITDGLPAGNIGCIGLDYYRKDPNVVYMVLETEKTGKQPENAAFAGLRGEDADVGAKLLDITEDSPAAAAGLKVDDIVIAMGGETVHSWSDLQAEIRKHMADETVGIEVSRDRKSVNMDITFAKMPGADEEEEEDLDPAERRRRDRRNRSPFDGGLGGQRENMQDQQGEDGHEYGGLFKSTDGGDTWTRINSVNPRPMYYSEIRVDPSDDNHIWILGTSLYKTEDGGKTFSSDGAGRGVHVDHHSIWIDPDDGRHVLLGCDGGHYITYDRGENWEHLNKFAIGQFYHVTVGPRRDYMVYGGLQDNGSWGGPSRTGDGGPINADWFRVGGGDGFICLVDPDDPDQIYTESQGGSMSRINLRTGERGFIRPRAPRGTRYRFNWKTPFILSHHNSEIHYSAGNHVFRSVKKGDNVKAISPDITNTEDGSGSALSESPRDENVLYVGTTDGAFWMTKNGGQDWLNLFDLPEEEEASAAEESAEGGRGEGPRAGGRGDRGGQGGRGVRGQMLERLIQADANGDGMIQKDEAPERMAGMFDRLDTNGDGELDKEELEAIAQRMRGGQRPPETPDSPDSQEAVSDEAAPEEATEEATEEVAEEVAEVTTEEVTPEEAADETKPEAEAEEQAAEETTESTPESDEADEAIEDVVSGRWAATLINENIEGNQNEATLNLKMNEKGQLSGSMETFFSEGEITEGKYDAEKGTITFSADMGQMDLVFTGTLKDNKLTGTAEVGGGVFSMGLEATMVKPDSGSVAEAEVPSGTPMNELMPGDTWISSLEASRFEAGRVYVTFDGHRTNDDEPHLYVSEDYGRTWNSIRANLPTMAGSTRVIREDIENQNVLYLGCEFSCWVSIDRGESWTKLNNNLPTVAVHEIAIHPTAGEIVAGTHGRSLWAMDVTALRQMSADTIDAKVHLYKPNDGVIWQSDPGRGNSGLQSFSGSNPEDGTAIFYSLKNRAASVELEIQDIRGRKVIELEVSGDAGLHRIPWDLRKAPPQGNQQQGRRRFRRRGPLVMPGTYLVVLSVNGERSVQELTIMTDPDAPGMDVAQLNRQEMLEALMTSDED
ncbi:MAG: PDZ domain-containing protein [Planctomycetota bacterium]|nr:PDZ domain-containing protein [Planctomycetota bacterium]